MSAYQNILKEEIKFDKIKESDVAKEMVTAYMKDLIDYSESDIVIVGAGPAGLSCAYELSKVKGLKVAVVEASVSPGGGGWVSGQLMSAMVVRKPAHKFLDEVGIPYIDKSNYVVVEHAALFTSSMISKVIRGGVKLFNAVAVEDFIVRDNVVSGVVINWAPVTRAHGTQSCMDPSVLEAKVVVSGCGHDGPFGATGIHRLKQLGLVKEIPGMRALDMNAAEDALVEHTCEIVPGMVITGMEVAEAYGTSRPGATFGAMILSGVKAAHVALEVLAKQKARQVQ